MFLFSTYKGNVKIGQVKRLLESVEAQIMGNCLKSSEKADISVYFLFPALLVMRWKVETVDSVRYYNYFKYHLCIFLYCIILTLA